MAAAPGRDDDPSPGTAPDVSCPPAANSAPSEESMATAADSTAALAAREAAREKSSAALSSVFAAVALTVLKGIVGVLTGSLGILAEALHSALDLVAACTTWIAVRAADRPADRNHPYGHGKIENLSALFETLLLLVTVVWIVWESVQRLLNPGTHVHVTWWAFAVMGISIAVDVSRSRRLSKVARKYRSQALEADALHFRTDIWSSCVVILGLGQVLLARAVPQLSFLEHGDSMAALAVAAIVALVSLRLGWRSLQALLDASPRGGEHEAIAQQTAALAGVIDAHDIRIRSSGGTWFVDMHVTVDGGLTVRRSHAMTEEIEELVARILPGADVTVHVEPAGGDGD
jgi:cation diffusion facilitator family transporter